MGSLLFSYKSGFKADDSLQFAILRTAAHELTHHIAERNRRDYQRLQRFVIDNLMDKGLEQLIEEKQAQYAAQGVELTRERAIEEVVADGCEMMLKHSQAIQKLVEQDRSLAQKVLDWLRGFIEKLRKAFDSVSYEHREAALLMQKGTLKYLEGLQELWDQALMGTVEGSVQEYKQEHKGLKYSLRQKITYESLVQKSDIPLVYLEDSVGIIDRKAIINKGYENATANGVIGVSGMPAVHVKNIGRDVHVSKRSLGHGLDRRVADQSAAIQHIGELLKNSVLINEAEAKKESAESSYVLLGAGINEDDAITYVSFVVNRFSNDLERVDVLYSIKTKNRPAVQSTEASAFNALSPTDLTISIAEMLSDVKESFSDLLPKSVLDRFGVSRTETEISKYLRYQLRDGDTISSREALANALESTAQNDRERELLAQYKGIIKELDEDEAGASSQFYDENTINYKTLLSADAPSRVYAYFFSISFSIL
ncbi:MAG: hypothetical protein IJF65_04820 [Clostridia bacterium]|nr:hypothetical protein [Clostridia bacterium]